MPRESLVGDQFGPCSVPHGVRWPLITNMTSLLVKPWMIWLRNGLRHNPIARVVYQRWMARYQYEERFGERLLREVGPLSVVWDIGANVGLYTEQILERGARHVVAFEPAPAAVSALQHRFACPSCHERRVTIVPAALSDTSGTARFTANGSSATNRFASENADIANTVEVMVVRADEAVATFRIPPANVVKIDVEGFELEVLRGFGAQLGSDELRSIFIEVHFSRLHERGLDSAPTEIDALLTGRGFKVEWLDLSHACGLRA
jgi:FkbM family methyltransferase